MIDLSHSYYDNGIPKVDIFREQFLFYCCACLWTMQIFVVLYQQRVLCNCLHQLNRKVLIYLAKQFANFAVIAGTICVIDAVIKSYFWIELPDFILYILFLSLSLISLRLPTLWVFKLTAPYLSSERKEKQINNNSKYFLSSLC